MKESKVFNVDCMEYMDLMNKDVDVEISEKEFNDKYDIVASSLIG